MEISSLKNKKILVIVKEAYSYPLFFLMEKWRHDNDVAAFVFIPGECSYNKQKYYNDLTYYYLREKNYKVYDTKEISLKFCDLKSNKIYEPEYLNYITDKYTHYKNINQQIISTQFFSRYYHYRNYYPNCTYEEQLNWITLNYHNIEEILDDFCPDLIIDDDNSELQRTILNEVAHFRSIPYITLEQPRYETYKTYTYRLGYGVDKYLGPIYRQNCLQDNEFLKEEISYVEEFKRKHNILGEENRADPYSSYKAESIVDCLKTVYGMFAYCYDQDIRCKNYYLKKKSKLLFPDSIELIKYFWNRSFKRRKYLKKNTIFEDPVEGEDYVYMPLHLIPESSTFVKAPFYINEFVIIEAVSKALPAGWRLYVKEHQPMLGERGIDFYKRVKKIPNVRLVQVNYYKDPKPWIVKAKGVVTISGTSAFEAALLGKKALVFADVMFGCIDGITKVNSFEELPKLIADFGEIDNVKSCAAYIRTVKDYGKPINMVYLMEKGERILRGLDEMDDQLDDLEALYLKAYTNFNCK